MCTCTNIIYDSMFIILKDLCTVPVLLLKRSATDLLAAESGYTATLAQFPTYALYTNPKSTVVD